MFLKHQQQISFLGIRAIQSFKDSTDQLNFGLIYFIIAIIRTHQNCNYFKTKQKIREKAPR